MKSKFTGILKDKCKDFGLTEQAIADLVEMGIEGLTEESSDEDFSKKADSLVPFAKMMQKEITRKSAKNKPQPNKGQTKEDDPEKGGGAGDEDMPAWAKAMQQSFEAMKAENEKLKADAKANDRKAQIQSKAKEMGIPEALMKRFSLADDADVDAELTAFKQDLINSSLMPKSAVEEQSAKEASMKAEAENWAKSLSDK